MTSEKMARAGSDTSFLGLEVGVVLPSGQNGVGHSVLESLSAIGCRVHRLVPRGNRWPTELDLIILYGPMASLGPSLLHLRRLPKRQRVVVWYTEPLPPPSWPSWFVAYAADVRCAAEFWLRQSQRSGRGLRWAGRLRCVGEMRYLQRRGMLDLLAVFTSRHLRFFERWNLPVALVPMGYHPSFGRLLDATRDIDVVFLGSRRDGRRRRIIGDLEVRLARAGVTFVIKDGSPEHGYAYGEERVSLLNRAKILLNIMRQPWDDPVFRMLLAAPNGAMMLSEPVLDAGPFESGRHFAVAELSGLVDAVGHYLDAEGERRNLADAASAYVTRHLTMERMAGVLLQAWHASQGTNPSVSGRDLAGAP